MGNRAEAISEIVGASQYGENTLRRERCRLVDRHNPRVGVGGADEHRVPAVGQREIVNVAACSGEEAKVLLAPNRLTDAVGNLT